ncbi:zinc finger protein Noc-like [Tachypleus tridentatus]|uniref:zinc finger protein Noc-like n=1 Tax=Tachypleus tridentatus TaxID=6853 RepID=UPI003FD0A9AE
MSLLTGNQYLRPEYLSPLPTTLDAKKSPLALLAQTCNNIGADNPNHKPIIPALEKSRDSEKTKNKCSNSEDKPAFKSYEPSKKDLESNGEAGKKTPSSKTTSPVNPCSSPAESCGKISPSGNADKIRHSTPTSENCSSITSASSNYSNSNSISVNHNTLSGLGYRSESSLGLDLGRSDSSKDTLSGLALGSYKHGLNVSLNPLANCIGCSPMLGHIPVDTVSTTHTFPSTIASQSGSSSLKPGGYTMGGLTPYVGYARVKTVGGGTAFVPVCRDPSCMNCQLSMQSAQFGQCPNGCTQCTHERIATLGGVNSFASLVPGLPGSASPGAGGTSALSGLNSQLFSHAVLPRPNVCSWMVGDTYCGKRFTSSEELLQHLRTHTNLSAADSASYLPMLSPSLSVPSAPGLGAAACHLHYSSPSPFTTSTGLRRTYPTSLSPVSSLNVNRFHPYKTTFPNLPGVAIPPLPHPSMYYPYNLYGQRLGPPVHP